MKDNELQLLRVIIGLMRSPRNRFGRIDCDRSEVDTLHSFNHTFGKLPHGGYDSIDKAQMLLSLMIGDEPVSILDLVWRKENKR